VTSFVAMTAPPRLALILADWLDVRAGKNAMFAVNVGRVPFL